MNIARNGDHALIIDLDSLDDVVDLHAQIQALDLPQVRELVPAARTITVHLNPHIASQADTAATLETLVVGAASTSALHTATVTIPTRYDGPDVSTLAAHLGISERELIDAHTSMEWRAAFGGFAPGFTYLPLVLWGWLGSFRGCIPRRRRVDGSCWALRQPRCGI